MDCPKAYRILLALIVTATILAGAGLGGCKGRKTGSIDQITIVTYRRAEGQNDGVVRIVGLARNTGELPTPKAEIVATLHSRTGSFKGQNRVELPALAPGAEHRFGIGVESHGSVESVELAVVEVGTVVEEGDEQAPVNAGEDAPGNTSEEGDQDGS